MLKVQELQPEELEGLTCPKRPKWSYSSTKKEVEKNEGKKPTSFFVRRARRS